MNERDYGGREADKICKRCGCVVYKEFDDIDYPYVCLNCDENKYGFEVKE